MFIITSRFFCFIAQDKYILSGKQLVVKQLPLSKIHPRIWKGSDKKFQAYPMRKQHAERVNKVCLAAFRVCVLHVRVLLKLLTSHSLVFID